MNISTRRSTFSQFSDDLWLKAEHDGTRIDFDVAKDDLLFFANSMIDVAIECLRKSEKDTSEVEKKLCNAMDEIDNIK